MIALNAAGAGVTADALGETFWGLMGVPGWGPPAVRVGTVAALGVAVVVVAAGAAMAAGWPEGGRPGWCGGASSPAPGWPGWPW